MSEHYVEPEVLKTRSRGAGAYLFLLPALVLLLVFFLYPMVWMISTSLSEYDPVTGTERTVGLSYYSEVLASPPVWRGILNTAYFAAVYVPLTFAVSGGLALLLVRPVRSRGILRAVFCAPCVIPVVAAALVWRSAYMPVNGSIDRLLSILGYEHGAGWTGWLGEPYLAMPCIALMCVWRDTGFFALIFVAALARIPRETYELACVDGASRWQALRHVTVPMCAGALALAVVLLVINVQAVFQEIYVMTEDGGPANWTVNIPFLVYRKAYLDNDWGHAAAISVVLFAVTVVVILIQNRMLNKRLGWS